MRQPRRTSSVPITATGTTGAPVSSARRPTPRRGSPSGPGRTRVPSGKTTTQSPRCEDRARGGHRVAVARAAIDRERAERVQHPRLPALLEQLALGHVVDGAAHERADHERVEEAAVVGGQQQRPAARQVLAADPLQAEVDEEERHEHAPQGPVDDRVDARSSASARESRRDRRPARPPAAARDSGRSAPCKQYTVRGRAVTVPRHSSDRAGVAQLVEHLSCKQEVRGSRPLSGSQ